VRVCCSVIIQAVPHQPDYRSESRSFDPQQIAGIPFLLAAWIIFLLLWDDKQAWLLSFMLVTLTGLIGGDRNLPEWLSRVRESLAEAATCSPDEIIEQFVAAAENWRMVDHWMML